LLGPARYVGPVAIVAALAASVLYALASVLQQREAERQPSEAALRLSLVVRLARRPGWLVGLVFDAGGYACQWLALEHGSLVVVQPLLVTSLLFALPVKARLVPYRMGRRDWNGAVLTTAGLAVFLLVGQPLQGHLMVAGTTWALLLSATGAAAAVLVSLGRKRSPRWKAVAFGTAGGVLYGASAALTKSCAHLLSHGGLGELLGTWEPYAMLAWGLAGMVLSQSAFQAGPLDASLPTLTATDPVVSVLIGAFVFGEALRAGLLASTAEVAALSAVVAGVFLLAHTEATKAAQARHLELASS
jgi:drug/metabolite transporter (DMT)-like permease